MTVIEGLERRIVGGVDTHKDLHVAAVVDEQDRVLGTHSFATTRQAIGRCWPGCDRLATCNALAWKSTGSYGAGLLRFMQQAGVAARGHDPGQTGSRPARQERRYRRPERRSCCFRRPADRHPAEPRSLRVLVACRKTAVAARRVALQMIQNTIVCALTAFAITCGTSPAPTRPHAGLMAAGSYCLSRRGSPPIASASSPSPAVTSNCMMRSRISTQ